jgi:hypothetical protein
MDKHTILLRICLTVQSILSIMRCGDIATFSNLQEILISLIMKQSQPVLTIFHYHKEDHF